MELQGSKELLEAEITWSWVGSHLDTALLRGIAAIPPSLTGKSPFLPSSLHHGLSSQPCSSMFRERIPPNPALTPETKDTPNSAWFIPLSRLLKTSGAQDGGSTNPTFGCGGPGHGRMGTAIP